MRVRIQQTNRRLAGEVGEEVECDAAIGNKLAGIGVVVITVRDKPANGEGCIVVEDEADEQDHER